MNERIKDTCFNCKYWKKLNPENIIYGSGRCRRFPPSGASRDISFPLTNIDDWCGEYERAD